MKIKLIALVATIFTAGIVLAGSAVAKDPNGNYRGGDTVTLEQSKTVDGAYYAAGDTVNIAGTVNGDLYCAGRNINVTGSVDGDVFCAGQNVKIAGTVSGDIRAAGQTVTIDGSAQNVTAFGDVVDIAKTATIARDLNGASNSLTIDGKIGRDVTLGGNTVTILGSVGRDVAVTAKNLSINNDATVAGSVGYRSPNTASIAAGSVKGEVKYTHIEEKERSSRNQSAAAVASFIYMLLAFIVFALGITLIIPRHVNAIGSLGISQLGMSILVGIAALFAAPIVLVFIGLTIIGIPLAIFLGVFWMLLLALSGPMFAYYIGRLLVRTKINNIVLTMLIGAAVLAVLFAIPVINIIAGLVSAVVGTGMLGLYITRRLSKPNYEVK